VMGEKAIAFIICETYHAMRVRIYGFRSMAIAAKLAIYLVNLKIRTSKTICLKPKTFPSL